MSNIADARSPNPAPLTLIERHGRVAAVVLNRPKQRNAISLEMREALLAAIESLHADSGCDVIVLAGAGGHFCSGGDLKAGGGESGIGGSRAKAALLQSLVRLIVTGPKVVVAAVEGAAYGAGFALATAADVLVAADDAQFCAPFVKIGLLPDAGLMWSLQQRVGSARAKRLMLTGEVIRGERAVEIGLVDEVAPAGGALDRALATGQRFTGLAPLSVAAVKRAMSSDAVSFEAILGLEAHLQPLLSATSDFAEGRSAFAERRQPLFHGR